MLYDYIAHRIYKFSFRNKSNIIDKESYFIPAGFDSNALLISNDIQGDLNKLFNEKISNMKTKNLVSDEELVCEDAQSFLKKFYGFSSTNKAKPNNQEATEKQKLNLNNYSTNTNEDNSKSISNNMSTGKIQTNYKELYNTNNENKNNGDTINKEDIMNKIKNQEMEKLIGTKSNNLNTNTNETSKETKSSAGEMLKKRLDALKKGNK